MDNLEVSLVKELCPVCCNEMDGPIIMNSTLTEEEANKVKDLQGKVVGFADHCCEECAKHKNDVVWLIEIDEDTNTRTGNIYGIKRDSDFIKSVQDGYIAELKDGTRLMYVDSKVCEVLGLCSK